MDRGLVRGRRLTRQDFLLLSAGAGAGLALAGCGGSQSDLEKAGSGGKSYNGPKVSLAFWNGFTGGDGPYMQKLVDQFNSEEKNIDVSMNTVEWETYYQKVPSAVQSGKGPDLGIMHIDQLPTNAARGVILALDDVASALKLKESDFVPVVWNAGRVQRQAVRDPPGHPPAGPLLQQERDGGGGPRPRRARPRPKTTTWRR